MAGQSLPPFEMLERLIGFDTTSRKSNLDLIDFVADYLDGYGVPVTRLHDGTGTKANLFATIGPPVDGGIVLSGHTDVVPVDGQPWDTDPFTLVERDGRLYGRGTADMKSFPAVALALVPEFLSAGLKRPVHFAWSYDEEVGCLGAPQLVAHLSALDVRPHAVIVGEPTEMKLMNRHKGVFRFRTTVTGLESHSAYTDRGVSAIFHAGEMIHFLHGLAGRLREQAAGAGEYDPPYHTVHVGVINGGTAPNIVPRECIFDWESRLIPGADIAELVTGPLERFVHETVLPQMQAVDPDAGVTTEPIVAVPGLRPEPSSPAEQLARVLTGDNAPPGAVSFGTEAGLFQNSGVPTIICGPGSILQAHRANEYVEREQVEGCIAFMHRLISHLAAD